MKSNTHIVFYKNSINLREFIDVFDFNKDKWIFIKFKEYKEKESLIDRFIENELTSIEFLSRFYRGINFFRKFLRRDSKSQINDFSTELSRNQLRNKEFKDIFEYITPEINEKSEKLSIEYYNLIKDNLKIKEEFIIEGLNLYEINRIEFVYDFYYLFLNFLTITEILSAEKPSQIFIMPSVNINEARIISTLGKNQNIKVKKLKNIPSKKQRFINFIKNSLKNVIERIWFWEIWKILNIGKIKYDKIDKSKKIVLYLAHNKSFFTSLNSVLKILEKENQINNILFVPHKILRLARDIISKEKHVNVIILPISDYRYKIFRIRYKKLKELLENIRNTNSLSQIEFESINFSKIIFTLFLNLFEKLMFSLRYLESINKVVNDIKIDLICALSGNDANDILVARHAKTKKIPTLFFPHSLVGIQKDYVALEQDFVVCSGERDKEYYISLGTDSERIQVLGLPLFDRVFDIAQMYPNQKLLREKIISDFKLDPKKKLVILPTTHDEDFIRNRVFETVVRTISSLDDVELIVKIHPIEHVKYYKNLANQLKLGNVIIVRDYDLRELEIGGDLIIGRSSNAQIEALLLDKNVIDISYESSFGRYMMEKFGAVLPVFSPDSLVNAIKKALFDTETQKLLKKGRKKYIEYSLYKFDGKASKRVSDLIKKTIKI